MEFTEKPNNMKRAIGKLTDRVSERDTAMMRNALLYEQKHGRLNVSELAGKCKMSNGMMSMILSGQEKAMSVKNYNKIFDYLSGKELKTAEMVEVSTPKPQQIDPNIEMVVKSLKYLEQKYGKVALELAYMEYSLEEAAQ